MPQRGGKLTLPSLALVVLGPGDLLFRDELLELVESALFLGPVEADADELDPLVAVLGVKLLHLGHLGDARAAPSRPEIDHHDFTLESLDGNGRALDGVGELEVKGLADRFVLATAPFDPSRVPRIRKILEDSILEGGFQVLVFYDVSGGL